MENIQLAIGKLLLIGILVSFIIVFIGGSLYLWNHGADIVHYQAFHSEPQFYKSIVGIFLEAFTFSPLALVQLGLLILVVVQILRVGLTTWLFVKSRDNVFSCISLFILLILIYSLI